MSSPGEPAAIRLRGVRQNNLKNFDLDLPCNRLIVVTGLSGSGKSSLAFETLFAEGQRRYIETFSPYARQFFDRMDKPKVDRIEGIPPAIAIEQRNAVRSTRSTVGTMTEVCDHMKVLWPHLAQLHCKQCGRPVRKDTPQQIWRALMPGPEDGRSSAPVANPGDARVPAAGAARRVSPDVLITFDLGLTEKLPLEESLTLISRQGYQRLLIPSSPRAPDPALKPRGAGEFQLNEASPVWNGASTNTAEIVRVEDAVPRLKPLEPRALTVVQDRIALSGSSRARFVEACEQAYHFGKGRLSVHLPAPAPAVRRFSNRLHCASCNLEYREPSPALFSFNHPVGACPTCRGFGRIIRIDPALAIPDRSLTLAEGAVRPWQTGTSAECQADLMKFCKIRKAPVNVPFERMEKRWQDWVLEGDPDYGKDKDHEWPRAWYGVKGYFRWLESKSYKMHVRVLLSRYRSYIPCPDCGGRRFQPEALLYRAAGQPDRREDSPDTLQPESGSSLTLADFYRLPIRDALKFIETRVEGRKAASSDPFLLALHEVRSRLEYLVEVGLGYLTLDRTTRSLSGGETERVNLTTCLGTRLVNTLYILDEPSVGLHARDTARLIAILKRLRDLGNTVVVVEHEASVIRAADLILDLGPGHGESGGQIVFQGPFNDILRSNDSLTGRYLSGRRRIDAPRRRPVRADLDPAPAAASERPNESTGWLRLRNASMHNLREVNLNLPLDRLVCVTGVSGSGKTTLIRDLLLPALESRLRRRANTSRRTDQDNTAEEKESEESRGPEEDSDASIGNRHWTDLEGWEALDEVVLVDQSPLGRTPRSNPAVYIGAFAHLREFFARTDAARKRGLNASAFSFNSPQGQCERCRGAGFEKIEMQFLSDVFIRCPECEGRRYRAHILDVTCAAPLPKAAGNRRAGSSIAPARRAWSIADLLDATVEMALEFLGLFPDSRPAQHAAERLKLLGEVGLGYLRLGQPINTLSGGESQRLKLVSHLAESAAAGGRQARTLFLFDEPTTGLHFEDVRVLLGAFQRIVDAGHSIVVIEHNLDVIRSADWVIDLGPEAGEDGGRIVSEGTPEAIAASPESRTGTCLRDAALASLRVER